MRHAKSKTDRLSRWVLALEARRGKNLAAVALANKLARIAWAVLARERTYHPIGWAVPSSNPPPDPVNHEAVPPIDCEGEETQNGTTGQTDVLRFRPA